MMTFPVSLTLHSTDEGLRNGREWQMKPGFRSHLDAKLSNEEYVEIIEPLMIKPPGESASSASAQSVK